MACSTILKQDTQGSSPLPRREVTFRCRRNGSRRERQFTKPIFPGDAVTSSENADVRTPPPQMDVCTRDRLRFAFVLRFSGSIRTARCALRVSTRLLLLLFSASFFPSPSLCSFPSFFNTLIRRRNGS